MLEKLAQPTFAQQINTQFQFRTSTAYTVSLDLIEVSDVRTSARHEAFSLVFRGPADAPLPQGMYDVEHETIGTFDLFIVPIGRETDGLLYEAIFNRLRSGESS